MLLSDKQKAFVGAMLNERHRWYFKGGATRSGKTYLDYHWVIPMRIRERIGQDGLCVLLGVTKSTIERNVLEPMRAIYGDGMVSGISSDNTAVLFGEKCYCLGAEKTTQVSKIRGASIKYAYGDEVADWSPDVFTLLKSRLDKPYSVFDGTYNPQSPRHWLKAFLDSDADIYSQLYTIDDNPFLPPAFVDALKSEYAGTVFYDRYILGAWTLAEGLIYPMHQEALEDAQKPPEHGYREYVVSIDYGTQNAFAALLWADDGRTWHAIAEYRYSGRDTGKQKTDADYVQDVERFVTDNVPDGRQSGIETIIDPSAASFIEAIRRSAYRFRVRKGDNDVTDGIRDTATCMQRGAIKIARTLTGTVRELEGYAWDKKEEDKPIKVEDHCMDALRYFVRTKRLAKRTENAPLSPLAQMLRR